MRFAYRHIPFQFAGLLFLLSVSLLALSGCDFSFKKEAKAEVPEKKLERIYPVRVQTTAVCPLKYEVLSLGAVEAQDVYQIHALVAGTLYEVNFNEGDSVKKDRVLCRVAPEAYRFKAQQTEGVYKNAVAARDDFKRKMENEIKRTELKLKESTLEIGRRKSVNQVGAISNEEMQLFESHHDLAEVDLKDMREQALTQLSVLEASIIEKDAAWKIALDDVRKSTVLPPIDGTIETRAVTNGMFVTPGQLLATMVDRTQLKLHFKIAEKDTAGVHVGQIVHFNVPAYPGREFESVVYFIGNKLDMETRTLDCYAHVTKDPDKLKPGYFASAHMVTGGKERAVVVPNTALLPTEKGFVAYVIKNGHADVRYVKTGMNVTDNSLEVLTGIAENEMLVVEGANALQSGVAVRVLNDISAAPAAAAEVDAAALPSINKDGATR